MRFPVCLLDGASALNDIYRIVSSLAGAGVTGDLNCRRQFMPADIKTFSAAQGPLRKPLGEIFVERGLLTAVSVQRLVEHAKSKNIRVGELLEVIGLVTPEELAEALAVQY